MAVNYKPLWIRMVEQDMNKTELSERASISGNAIAKMGKNEYVSLHTLEKICLLLDCQLSDIVRIEK